MGIEQKKNLKEAMMEKLKWTIGVLTALSIIGAVVPGYTDEAIKKVDIEKEKNEQPCPAPCVKNQQIGNSSSEYTVREKPLVETGGYRESDKESNIRPSSGSEKESQKSEKEPHKIECPPPCK